MKKMTTARKPDSSRRPPAASNAEDSPLPTGAQAWSGRKRFVVSVLVLLHLSAVIIAATPPSDLAQDVSMAFRPYINAADLSHGYRFFAPDPGPSHLVRYRLEYENKPAEEGTLPNLNVHWPRLLYHRYFMLSEHLFDQYRIWHEEAELQKEIQEGHSELELSPAEQTVEANATTRDESMYRAMAQSYADELLRRTGAKRVSLKLIVHAIPTPNDVLHGRRLDDKSSYRAIGDLGTFTATPLALSSEAKP